jgi:hypothetical protein
MEGKCMGLFRSGRPLPPRPPAELASEVPISQIDLSKRYDVYYYVWHEERLYEGVRFLGIRTFDRLSEFSSGLAGGFLEVAVADGSRMLLPTFGIQMICEHGTQPVYTVLRTWGADGGWR